MNCRGHDLPSGDVRVYEPAPESDDASPTYVLAVLGFSIMVRRWQDGEAMDSVVEISDDPGGTLTVHVRGTETTYG